MRMQRPIAWLTLVAFLAGCATHKSQAVPDFSGQAGQLTKIGIVVDAQVKYHSFVGDKGGELSAQAVKELQAAAVRELSAKGYVVTVLPANDDTHALLSQYKNIRGDLYWPFRETRGKIARVAPMQDAVQLAKKAGVDGIAIVCAEDSVSSPGVTFVTGVAVVALVVLEVVLLAHGGGGPGSTLDAPFPGGPPYNADFAILDKSGKIVFHERSALKLTDVQSISRASAVFADDVMAAR